MVVAIDVDRGREGDERIALFGRLEGREDAALGRAQADDPGGLVLRRERKEVVGVDRELRAFLDQEVERRLPDDFAITTGWRHLESNTGCVEVNLRHVQVDRPRFVQRFVRIRDADIRLRHLPAPCGGRAGQGRHGQDERGYGPDEHPEESSSGGPQIC